VLNTAVVGDRAGGEQVAELSLEGEYWTVEYGGRRIRVRDSKGMGYLARLLADPGREIPVTAFADHGTEDPFAALGSFDAGLVSSIGSDLGPALDAQAKLAYRERLAELRAEMDEADKFHDPERASRSRVEYEAIVEELASATGLGGRDRRQGSPVERVRLSVTRTIRRAVKRIAEHDRALGQHFATSVHTGRVCVYRPAQGLAVRWHVATRDASSAAASRVEPLEAPTFPAFPPGLAEENQFIGREAELRRLKDHWTRDFAGRCELILVTGEAGIGKTRLVGEFARRAYVEGALVLHGRCDEDGVGAYQPWVESLEGYAAACPATVLRQQASASGRELARLLPSLRQRLPDLPLPASGDAVAERYWLFESVRDFLARISEKRRVLLVLDDLHWADRPTLLLLKHLVRAQMPAPVMIVGTYRSGELHDPNPLPETLAALRREQVGERMSLDGLTEPEARSMIAAWAGGDAPFSVVHTLWERTEGHPFFLREVLSNLLERGAIEASSGLAELASLPPLAVPAGVREVVADRLRRLPPAARRVLSTAAVFGQEFAVDGLEIVCGVHGDALFALLQHAVDAQLVAESPVGVEAYRFSHALVRQTLYEQLTGPHRARVHERIAQALEAVWGGTRAQHAGELAYHFLQAPPSPVALIKATEYAVLAAGHALRQLAYEEAAVEYEHALHAHMLRGGNDLERCGLLLALGEARLDSGDRRAARATFRDAIELAERLGDHEHFARAALGLAGQLGDSATVIDPERIVMLERALAMIGPDLPATRARLAIRLAEALAFTSRHAEAPRLAELAISIARQIGEPSILAEVLVASLQARANPDNFDEQLATILEVKQLAQGSGESRALVLALFYETSALLSRGRLAESAAARNAISPLAQLLRHPYYEWLDALATASFAFFDRSASEVEPLIWTAKRIGQDASHVANAMFEYQLELLRWVQGRHEETLPAIQSRASKWSHPLARCMLAVVFSELGRDTEAAREFEELALNDFRDLPHDYAWLNCLEFLADVCAHLGDVRRARMIYDLMLPYAQVWVSFVDISLPFGLAHRQLALLAATYGDYERAIQHFDAAVGPQRMTGSPYAVARCRYEYARMLLTADAVNNRDRVLNLIRQVRQDVLGFEMRHLGIKLDALAAHC
jgi:tetratricopeptide (TPR) repeat protein